MTNISTATMIVLAIGCFFLVPGPIRTADAMPLPDLGSPTRPSDELHPPSPTGAVWPVPGQVVRSFDPPDSPYGPGHRGVDLAAAAGQDVRAVMRGTILYSGVVNGVGWVTVDHGGGLRTTYGALDGRATQRSTVGTGDVIGQLADTADHLDWGALLDGVYLDPLTLFGRWRMSLTASGNVGTG